MRGRLASCSPLQQQSKAAAQALHVVGCWLWRAVPQQWPGSGPLGCVPTPRGGAPADRVPSTNSHGTATATAAKHHHCSAWQGTNNMQKSKERRHLSGGGWLQGDGPYLECSSGCQFSSCCSSALQLDLRANMGSRQGVRSCTEAQRSFPGCSMQRSVLLVFPQSDWGRNISCCWCCTNQSC